MEKKWLVSRTAEDYDNFKHLRSQYIDMFKVAKSSYYSTEVEKCDKDQHKLFK